MAKFTRIDVANQLAAQGLLPLFYHPDLEVCKKLAHAIYDGGGRLIEFTNRGDFSHEIFGALNKYCLQNLPEMMLGVGSVCDGGTTSMFLQLGANFIVSPLLRKDIAITCNRRKVLWSPGCATLGEIAQAEEWGAEIVKLFPGSVLGPGFVKAIKGPQPWTSIMPTGGVSPDYDNLKAWFSAGVTCVGMGSKLIVKNKEGTYDYAHISSLVEQSLSMIQSIRSES